MRLFPALTSSQTPPAISPSLFYLVVAQALTRTTVFVRTKTSRKGAILLTHPITYGPSRASVDGLAPLGGAALTPAFAPATSPCWLAPRLSLCLRTLHCRDPFDSVLNIRYWIHITGVLLPVAQWLSNPQRSNAKLIAPLSMQRVARRPLYPPASIPPPRSK